MSFNRNEIEEFQNKEQDLMEVFKTKKRCDIYKKSANLVHNLYVKKNLIGLWYENSQMNRGLWNGQDVDEENIFKDSDEVFTKLVEEHMKRKSWMDNIVITTFTLPHTNKPL